MTSLKVAVTSSSSLVESTSQQLLAINETSGAKVRLPTGNANGRYGVVRCPGTGITETTTPCTAGNHQAFPGTGEPATVP